MRGVILLVLWTAPITFLSIKGLILLFGSLDQWFLLSFLPAFLHNYLFVGWALLLGGIAFASQTISKKSHNTLNGILLWINIFFITLGISSFVNHWLFTPLSLQQAIQATNKHEVNFLFPCGIWLTCFILMIGLFAGAWREIKSVFVNVKD